MKLSIERKTFLEALSLVGLACGTRTTLPILGNVKLVAGDKFLVLTTTDLDCFISVKVESESETPGAVTAPARMLRDFVNRVDSSRIVLESQGGESLRAIAGDAEAIFGALDPEDFPPPHKVEKPVTFKCLSSELTGPLCKVAHAMSNDPTRYVLQGVNFAANGSESLHLAATGGARLSICETEIALGRPIDYIVPDRAVHLIVAIFGGASEDIEVAISESVIRVSGPAKAICARLIEGKYPNFKAVMPAKSDTAFTCNRADLIRAIETTRIFVEPPAMALRISGKKKSIEVSSPGDKSRVGLIGAELTGQPSFAIHFNWRYLLDALKVLSGDTVRIQVTDEMSPMLIEEGTFKEVVTPMRVGG